MSKDVILNAIEEITDTVKDVHQKHRDEIKALKERTLDLEQRGAMYGGGNGSYVVGGGETLGAQAVKQFGDRLPSLKTNRGAMSVECKTITSTTGSGAALYAPRYDLDPVVKPKRPLRVRDLLEKVPTDSPVVNWVKQTTRTNNADVVSEGITKPTSVLAWDVEQNTTSVIASLIKASVQVLDDSRQLQAIIDSELQYMLDYTEEQQLLTGDGTGQNLSGLITNCTNYSGAFSVTGEKNAQRLGLAKLQVDNADVGPCTAFVMHSTDAMKIRLVADTLGRPIYAQEGPLVLYGVPVVESRSMSAGHFLALAGNAARIYDQWSTRIEVATQNSDDFERNLITIRAEKRLTLACRQPLGIVYGALVQ